VEIEVTRTSGREVYPTPGAEQLLVAWPAAPSASRERAEVRVRVPGGAWAEPLLVVARLLDVSGWHASFVTPIGEMATGEPAPVLHGVVDVPAGVVSVRLYASRLAEYASPPLKRAEYEPVLEEVFAARG
jgi:alpha-L-rhamnosidase